MTANRGSLSFPRGVSSEARDLITRLLERDASHRLTNMSSIKSHPFCKDIDWDSVLARECNPPLKVDFYQSNFDNQYTQMPITINSQTEDYDVTELQTNTKKPAAIRRSKSFTHFDALDFTLKHIDEGGFFEKTL